MTAAGGGGEAVVLGVAAGLQAGRIVERRSAMVERRQRGVERGRLEEKESITCQHGFGAEENRTER